jgi:phage major head subunit gpT-like protein
MLITVENLNALRVTFQKRFHEGYEAADLVLNPLYTEIGSSTKSNRYGWVAQQLGLRKWVGPRVIQNLSEHSYDLVNESYEGTVEVDRDDIEDDNLGMYDGVAMPQLGEAVRKHPEEKVAALIQANPVAFDGKALFANDHPCFDKGGSTYDNLHSLALSAENIAAVMAEGAQIKGEDGKLLKVRYTHILVAPQKEFEIKQILNSSTYVQLTADSDAVAIDNQMRGVLTPIVSGDLAGDPTAWYLFDCSKAIKPIIRQVRRAPEFVARDNPQDPKVFDLKKYTYGVDLRDAYGVSLPFLAAKSKP